MATPNTLEAIRDKVRRLTARLSPDQMSDLQIHEYINTYYLYDMPESLRLLKLKDTYTFTTIPNVETYEVPDNLYMTFEPPAYVGGQLCEYFQDIQTFYMQWPKINYIQQVGTGDGINAGPYTGTITGTPFMRSILPSANQNIPPISAPGKDIRVMISVNTTGASASPPSVITVFDDGNGGFIDSVTGIATTGTINYNTGVFSVTFPGVPPAGSVINATVIPYQASMPRTMCFYQNQMFLRPIPDKAYIVEINAFRYPTQLLLNTDQPELAFWWQLLAFGAARKILVDNGDYENAQAQEPYFLEQLAYVQRRTLKLLSTQRAQTIYSGQGSFPFSNLYPYI